MTEYRVGDRGVTRDGRELECCEDRGDGFIFPLGWVTETGISWWTKRDGRYHYERHDRCDIIRRIDDANPAAEVTKDEPPAPSTLRTRAKFESDEHDIGGVHIVAMCSGGKVSLFIGAKEFSEDEAGAVVRTIETVMEQARRAKEVMP